MIENKIREFVWRLGRKLYMHARHDNPNNPESNGEYWLLDLAIRNAKEERLLLMDVGANKGDWSVEALKILDNYNKNGNILAFEPAPATFKFLKNRIAEKKGRIEFHANQIALSNLIGKLDFYIVNEYAGSNSLHNVDGGNSIEVQATTLDYFVEKQDISKILFIKIDAEGNDLRVIEGGINLLKENSVEIIQFEYNHRWIWAKSSLKDVFDLIKGNNYIFGKLYGDGVEVIDEWHLELERYFEGNYILVRGDSDLIPKFTKVKFGKHNTIIPK